MSEDITLDPEHTETSSEIEKEIDEEEQLKLKQQSEYNQFVKGLGDRFCYHWLEFYKLNNLKVNSIHDERHLFWEFKKMFNHIFSGIESVVEDNNSYFITFIEKKHYTFNC